MCSLCCQCIYYTAVAARAVAEHAFRGRVPYVAAASAMLTEIGILNRRLVVVMLGKEHVNSESSACVSNAPNGDCTLFCTAIERPEGREGEKENTMRCESAKAETRRAMVTRGGGGGGGRAERGACGYGPRVRRPDAPET